MESPQSKSRLLLVDADPKSLRVLDVSLKKAGFDVTTAASGHDALASLEAEVPDLIISDTDLREMDGFELCNRIKAKPDWAKIPFLFVSGRKSIEDKIRGLELGVDDYLTKPIYIKEIGIRVRTALQRAERERMESRREGRTRFAGALSDVGVVDLVQTIELNRKSGIIHIVNRDDRRGSIFFRDGKVVDAEVGRLSGAHALYRMFSWSEGQFAVEFKHIRRHDAVDLSMAALLMEGMRRLDESTHLLENLPSPHHVLEVDCRVLAEELAELPDEMNSVLRLCDGARTLQEVVEDSDLPDLETLTVISNLYLGQIIFAREAPDRGGEPQAGVRLANWLSEGGADAAGFAPKPTSNPTAQAAVHQTPMSAVLLPGVPALPETLQGPMSAEETLVAALPSRMDTQTDIGDEANDVAATLKGVPLDNLFVEAQVPERSEALAPPEPSPPPTRDGARTTSPMGIAERLLSADSALHTATMHEVMADADGRVSEPQPVDRHTHSYGDPIAQAAAALVQEVVTSTRTTPPAPPPPPNPERPSKEVDWGAWPTALASQTQPATEGATVKPIPLAPSPPPSQEFLTNAPEPQVGDYEELSRADVLPAEPTPRRPDLDAGSDFATEALATPTGDAATTESNLGETGSPSAQTATPDIVLASDQPPRPPSAPHISLVPPPGDDGPPDPTPVGASPSSAAPEDGVSDALQTLRDSSQSGRLWLMVIAAFGLGVVGVLALGRRANHPDDAEPVALAESSAAPESVAPPSPPAEPAPNPPTSPPGPQPVAALPNPAAPAPSALNIPVPVAEPTKLAPAQGAPEADKEQTATLRQKCLETDANGRGKAKAVVSACRPALEATPADAEIMVILARAEIDRGRPLEARAMAKKALATDPQRLDAYVYLGTAEQAAGRTDEARAAYKKYLELAPDGPFARELRAILSNL